MAVWIRYRLAPRSALHIGERGVGLEEASVIPRSDTLFSALCMALRELGFRLDALLARWPRVYMTADGETYGAGETPPPFLLSSAFPCAGDVVFLPRPMLPLRGLDEQSTPGLAKRLKKARFVSERIYASLVAGHSIPPLPDVLVQDGEALATTEETQSLQRRFADPLTGSIRLWTKETVSHVALDRLSNKSNVYGVGQVTFAEGCGLAIIVEYHDQTLRPTVEQGLRLLGDAGLGGRRSTGHGQFTIQDVNPLQLPVVQAANAFTTLSLYWPPRPEVEQGALDGASYNLVNRRGWLGAPGGMNLRRRSVRMLTEGAVLRRAPLGALLADVKPLDPAPAANVPHDVWRYGLALSIPCCAPDDKEAANG